MSLSDAARAILDMQGRNVTLNHGGAEPLALLAVVSEYGFGPAPPSWPDGFTMAHGRHAAFRVHPEDALPRYGELLLFEGREYEIRAVRPEPACHGQDGPMWWVAMAVADQRGQA